MQEVRLNLYQADREFQVEIGGGGFGYRLFGPKFDGSSRLIKSVILSDRDKEEIIGYVKPDARAIEEELADYKAANASIREELRCRIKERDKLTAERSDWKARYQSVSEMHDALIAEFNEMRAENKRLRELVDGAQEVVEISNFTFPAQREWKAAWLKKAAKALKEASHESK